VTLVAMAVCYMMLSVLHMVYVEDTLPVSYRAQVCLMGVLHVLPLMVAPVLRAV
jgi:hypothetical protein